MHPILTAKPRRAVSRRAERKVVTERPKVWHNSTVGPRGRVWIVEDSKLEAELARQTLTDTVDLELFDDGAIVLERLAAGDVPDVLMLDWTLPSMTGIEVCRLIRETRDELALPILLVTSRRSAEDVAEAFAAGANDFVPKPYMPIELAARIRMLLRTQALRRRAVEAEREREVAELDHRALIEALSAQPMLRVCVVQGPDLVYTMANAAYVEHVAHGESVLGRRALDVLPELKDQGFEALIANVKTTGEAIVRSEIAIPVQRASGVIEEGFFGIVCQPIRGRDGDHDSALVIAHETTELVRARKLAQDIEEELRKRADFERQLIGIVSHDLRSPLGAIAVGTAVLLRHDSLDERGRKVVMRVQRSAERGSRLVGDLLDFTQARVGGGIPVHPAAGDLHAVVQQVVDDAHATSPDRVIEVTSTGDGHGLWDLERLAQVVGNLLGNALKYSPPASPVTVRCTGEEQQVSVAVHNAGEPIADDAIERIFLPMQRASSQLENSARSVGLGLFIVRHLVEAHGGSLGVTSSAEAGTTFTFRVPRRPGATVPRTDAIHATSSGP